MKKAILVVSFGTSHEDTRKVTIDAIENRVREEFKEYEIRRAYTSHMILKKIKERDGIIVDTPEAALTKLKEEGFNEVIVQPLHVIPGEEYDYVKKVILHKFYNSFDRLVVGRPLLYFKGEEEEIPDDYTIMANALKCQLPEGQAVILMGHGSVHPANSTYACFQSVLTDEYIDNVYMATVEGYPTLERAVKYLKKTELRQVTLMPFMIVAGDHAKNDMAGEDDDSWKNVLEEEGFRVNIYLHGLGENVQVQNIFLQHIKDAVDDKYINLGKTKKGGK